MTSIIISDFSRLIRFVLQDCRATYTCRLTNLTTVTVVAYAVYDEPEEVVKEDDEVDGMPTAYKWPAARRCHCTKRCQVRPPFQSTIVQCCKNMWPYPINKVKHYKEEACIWPELRRLARGLWIPVLAFKLIAALQSIKQQDWLGCRLEPFEIDRSAQQAMQGRLPLLCQSIDTSYSCYVLFLSMPPEQDIIYFGAVIFCAVVWAWHHYDLEQEHLALSSLQIFPQSNKKTIFCNRHCVLCLMRSFHIVMQGPILRPIQRYGRCSKRDGKCAPGRKSKHKSEEEMVKDPRNLYLSIDEASTHVGDKMFR